MPRTELRSGAGSRGGAAEIKKEAVKTAFFEKIRFLNELGLVFEDDFVIS